MASINDSCNYLSIIHTNDLKSELYFGLESSLSSLDSELFISKPYIKPQKFDSNNVQSHEEELECLLQESKRLRQEIEVKGEGLAKQKSQYECIKQDQKLLSREIKDTHEAFLMAKKYYKKYLKMYFTIESRSKDKQIIFIQFFTDAKKDNDMYSLRISRDVKLDYYTLLDTKPILSSFKELKASLQVPKSLPGTLCSIRQAFIKMKSNIKDEINMKV